MLFKSNSLKIEEQAGSLEKRRSREMQETETFEQWLRERIVRVMKLERSVE